VYYIEVEEGHDVFMISRKITRTYYILSGSGHFTIADRKYDVIPGMLVEVPPKVEYCYSGNMKLIALSRPRWFSGNDTFTKWNPDVVRRNSPIPGGSRSGKFRVFGKSPVRAYLRLNRRLWNNFPRSFTSRNPMRLYGGFLHALACIERVRGQGLGAFFLRNRPELELIRRLLERRAKAETLKVTVLGCGAGAEAYSVAWRIRSARPDLKLILRAVDISKRAVEFAKCGVYSLAAPQLTGAAMLERMTAAEVEELFDRDGDAVTVKSWIKEGMSWYVGDAGGPEILDALGPQDMVVANNFLYHMDAPEAEICLRNIARLVRPNGYLFVSGVDLDVRTKVACDLGWKPIQELLEEVHDGDPCLRTDWPFHYACMEPLNKKRRDWGIRYAAAFQLVPSAGAAARTTSGTEPGRA
jgi:SAM-dependent methyltransferase